MATTFRTYEPGADADSAYRVWLEVGWVEGGEGVAAKVDDFFSTNSTHVAEVDGSVECLVHWCPGTLEHTGTPLELAVVTSVTTSWVGRNQGLASRLCADALTEAAGSGAAVATLGMFEQGYYDRLGFGVCGYENLVTFDPRRLRSEVNQRPPIRLDVDDWQRMHDAMGRRMTSHGAVVLGSPEVLRAELNLLADPFFGLGFVTEDRLSHFIAGTTHGENGPYKVRFMSYENGDQLLELMQLLRGLADQVVSVQMMEPPHIQLQDLLEQPLRSAKLGEPRFPYPSRAAFAWQQVRILDLEACVSALRWRGPELGFNLDLEDPISSLLSGAWRGLGGRYHVRLGESCSVDEGPVAGLPTLTATVNAFSRLWLGVLPATSLAVVGGLGGPDGLLDDLDEAICLPRPRPGCEF